MFKDGNIPILRHARKSDWKVQKYYPFDVIAGFLAAIDNQT